MQRSRVTRPVSAHISGDYRANMNAEHSRTDREERWDDAKNDHWHGAEPSPESAQRETDAQTAQKARDGEEAQREAKAHEGRIGRWEAATGRIWNRRHGTGS